MTNAKFARLGIPALLAICSGVARPDDTDPVPAATEKIDADIQAEHYEAPRVDLDGGGAPDATKKQAAAPAGPPAPARLKLEDLDGMEKLSPRRRQLVALALRLGRQHHLNQYIYGSADPDRGGFDCSGAMFHLLQKSGLKPPRTSAGQYDWIQDAGVLITVPPTVTDLDDQVFSKLQPGDLLFWSGTYKPTDGRTNGITHVQMYLGKEKKDGRRVMIGSSDGRSYRGQRQCGYGVFDFRLPRQGSTSRFAGFGPPPGLDAAGR